MTKRIIDVSGLKKHFGGISATADLDFEMARGAKEAIIGPNGAGKSTFFNLLTGYHRVDGGTIVFDGIAITNWPPHKIARAGISRAFQVSNIFHQMTVHENVRCAVHARMGKSMNIFERADQLAVDETDEILELCGFLDRRTVVAGELPQGDKKKLELAIALAGRPKLLLLDEPTAGMSLAETRDTMALVDKLNADLGLSILFTEHDMSVVFNHAQHVTLLHRGAIIVKGTPQDVRNNETVQKIYLGQHH